jgi:hypothetical protein
MQAFKAVAEGKTTGTRLQAGPRHLAITRLHALFYLLSVFVGGVGGALEAIVNVLTYIFRTLAHPVSFRRSNQCGQHDDAARPPDAHRAWRLGGVRARADSCPHKRR